MSSAHLGYGGGGGGGVGGVALSLAVPRLRREPGPSVHDHSTETLADTAADGRQRHAGGEPFWHRASVGIKHCGPAPKPEARGPPP